ncbi:MAG: diacylglycerol kinase [Nitrospiria bacterium]
MTDQKKTGLSHFFHALQWSLSGLKTTYCDEAAFRQEVLLVAVCAPLAFWLGKTPIEKALMIGSLFIILIVEFLNTAIEAAIDRVGKEKHPLSKKAKDAGSAAVMFSLLNALVIWGMILIPKIEF